MLEELLYECLKTIQGGFYALKAPQNKTLPYSVYEVISDIKTNCADGLVDYPQIRFQIDVYSDTLETLGTIKDDIISKLMACDGFKCIIYQNFQNMTDEGNTFHSVIDFKLNI